MDDYGIINLAIAIIEQAKADYNDFISNGDDIEARVVAERDTRGLVGLILEWTVDDKEFLLKKVVQDTVF